MKTLLYILLLTIPLNSRGGEFKLKFNLPENDSVIQESNKVDSIRFETFRFYISEIQLFFSDGKVVSDSAAHLIDLSANRFAQIKMDFDGTESPDSMLIHFGTDSIINTTGAHGGDLDPTLGMYWTWQSGYVNYKLQGSAFGQAFEYHLGGYRTPYPTDRIKHFELKSDSATLEFNSIGFIEMAFDHPSRKAMSPGKLSTSLTDLFVSSFKMTSE